MHTCNCFRTFDRVARKIAYTTWAGISTFCPCNVIYYYRTSAGKSTFRTQNNTDKANCRCTTDKKFCFLLLKKLILLISLDFLQRERIIVVKTKYYVESVMKDEIKEILKKVMINASQYFACTTIVLYRCKNVVK